MEAMLVWGLGLLAAAVLVLVVEVFLPSAGILLVVSVGCALAGIVCLFRYDPLWGLSGTLASLVLGPVTFFSLLKVWRHTPIGRRMVGEPSEEEVEAKRQAEQREQEQRARLLGAEGDAITDLRPVGVVRIRGERYDALSETLLIPAGTRVRVTIVEANQIKVRPVDSAS